MEFQKKVPISIQFWTQHLRVFSRVLTRPPDGIYVQLNALVILGKAQWSINGGRWSVPTWGWVVVLHRPILLPSFPSPSLSKPLSRTAVNSSVPTGPQPSPQTAPGYSAHCISNCFLSNAIDLLNEALCPPRLTNFAPLAELRTWQGEFQVEAQDQSI